MVVQLPHLPMHYNPSSTFTPVVVRSPEIIPTKIKYKRYLKPVWYINGTWTDWDNNLFKAVEYGGTAYFARPEVLPENEKEWSRQIKWQQNKLTITDLASFWFEDGDNDLALTELGGCLQLNIPVVLGVSEDFKGRSVIAEMFRFYKPFMKPSFNFQDFIKQNKLMLSVQIMKYW